MTATGPSVVIIGAGIGGLAAAAILSRYADVTVFERASGPGGKIGSRMLMGQPIDSGPTVLTMKSVFESVFAEAGGDVERHVRLTPLETLARHSWPDGSSLELFSDIERSAEAIEAFASGEDAENYRRFCEKSADVFDTLGEPFLYASSPSLPRLAASTRVGSLFQLSPFSSLWRALSRAFKDERLRQLFARYATYCGASPFQAPATLMLIAHVERSGVWAIEGGIQRLAEALEAVAKANGAKFHYDADVTEIKAANSKVSGVSIRGVGRVRADAVISNVDTAALNSGALGPACAEAVKRQKFAPLSQSAMTWTFLARPSGRALSEHNVFFSDNYRAEFDAVFRKDRTPEHPTVYVHAPGPSSAGVRPVYCLINAPANGGEGRYTKEEIEACWTRMNRQVGVCGLTLNPVPETIRATTPDQFAERYPATRGALYGVAGHGWRAAFQRPGVRSKLEGLYLTGGSVHPGPGVPMAALSGRAAARAVISDSALTERCRPEAMPGGTSTASAMMDAMPSY